MATCEVCGEYENMPYVCNHCGGTYCGNHRLPENHDCQGLKNWNDPTGVFDSGFDDSVNTSGTKSSSILQKLGVQTGTGGLFAYFRSNMTYVFLMVMAFVFLLQFGVYPLLGFPIGSRFWMASFVIRPTHLEFVWTWITSIFSHGGITHLFANGIVIYFFGLAVERRIGSKRYTILFFVAGLVAGLGQMAINITLGISVGALGASGAALGLMAFLTVLNPHLKVYIWFILPVPIWLLTVGYALISLTSIGSIGGVGGAGVAHAAHLFGLITGLVYALYLKQQNAINRGGQIPGPFGGRDRQF